MNSLLKCPICGCSECRQDSYSRFAYECHECGKYRLGLRANSSLTFECERQKNRLLFHKYAAVMLERNLKGLNDGLVLELYGTGTLVVYATGERLDSYYPESYLEKFERGFCNIVRSLKHSLLGRFQLDGLKYNLHNLLYVEDSLMNPIQAIMRLVEIGWLDEIKPELLSEGRSFRITVNGFRHFEETKNKFTSSNAFLAMWFGVEDCQLYRQTVKEGVAKAGYLLQIVNSEPYNGFIMDKVINLIDEAAFVIADISAQPEIDEASSQYVQNGVRGGVYWEAGYARGQKKQVILTRRNDKDSQRRVHFDLAQYNQIMWRKSDGRLVDQDGNDLSEVICQRIKATVGRGPYVAKLPR